MTKRITALILTLLTLFSLLAVPANAASSLEEAMAEVNVYARNDDLDWLRVNGSVKTQHYTYYLYRSELTGQTKEIPAYCTDPRLYGVPALVDEGTAIKYGAEGTVTDPKIMGICANGYPHIDLATLGVASIEEAYYATKTALWCYLLSTWDIDSLSVNPNADQAAAARVLQATRDIYTRGMRWDKLVEPKLTATPDRDTAYIATVNGESVYQQIFTVTSETWSVEPVLISLAAGAPSGTKLLDMNGNAVSSLAITDATSGSDGYSWQVKVVYPASAVEGQDGTVQLNLSSVVVQYELFHAKCLETDTYGNAQRYVLDTDPHVPITASAISTYSSAAPASNPAPSTGETAIKITKLEEGTNSPLGGGVFDVVDPSGASVGSFSTTSNGTITIPVSVTGDFTVTERIAPANHLLPEGRTQHVTVVHGRTAEVTFTDAPYGGIRVEKYSDTGEKLAGVTVQVKHIATGATRSAQTNAAGVAEFTQLPIGGYEVRETAGIEGWKPDTETVTTVAVTTGATSTTTLVNKELPGLKIRKFDRSSDKLEMMSGVTFEIWRDGVSLGRFQTDAQGEIRILNAPEGTYLAQEIDTGSSAHILDRTPQQLELHAGDGLREMVFFNDAKPSINRLIKVDSGDLTKPIPNAVFEIKAVDGSYGPIELRTDEDGVISLENLPCAAGGTAYVVTEKSCPDGYLIDDAQRIIQLRPNDKAQFVFTNTKKPSLRLTKYASDGSLVEGASYRLAKIEDGSRYLDRTTSSTGEILWDGLEPGVYSLVETATRSNLILDPKEYHVQLFPGKTSEIVLENHIRPNLYVYKYTAGTSDPVEGCVLTVRAADGHSVDEIRTDSTGMATLANLLPGVYEISEKSVPSAWLMDAPSQLVTLWPDRDHTAYFYDSLKPNITVRKVNSVTGDPLRAKFHVEYASGSTSTGELNDLGYYYTDAATGEFSLTQQRDGWYRISEIDVVTGYAISEPSVQEFYLAAGASKTVTYEDTPLSAIVVWKYDSETGAALSSCRFELKYLSGSASGTGGVVVATATTSENGTCTFTGLQRGTYIVSELESDANHVISEAPQTVYISGEEQDVVSVYFGNVPVGGALIRKTDGEGKPLSGCSFLVTTSSGELVGDANGVFVTDASGTALVEGIEPGETLVIKETKTKDSTYVLDDAAQTVRIKPGRTIPVDFVNYKKGNLILVKRSSADKTTPLEGVCFSLRYADGSYVDADGGKTSSNGLYYTNAQGMITVSGIVGTVVATEVSTIDGYTIDENTRTQTVTVRPEDTQTLYVFNDPVGGVLLTKVAEHDRSQRIPNTSFEIRRADDQGIVTTITTGSTGTAFAPLEDNSYYAVETVAAKGYLLDSQPYYFSVSGGQTTPLVVTNRALSQIVIHKVDSTTGKGIYGARFMAYDSGHNPIAEVTSDQNGYAVIDGLTGSGRFFLRELENQGYIIDTQLKTVYVQRPGETTEVEWKNTPITGQIQITKTSADYNSMNGWSAGTPIPNTIFEVYDRAGNLVDTIKTDKNGIAATKPLPLGRYKLIESKAADFYGLDKTPIEVEIEFAGQIVKAAMTNKSLYTNVSIAKRGYVEVMPGQTIRYDFSGIANNSTTALESFYWRDTIPTNAVRLDRIVTGTWNASGSYKIVYKTNLTGGEYRVLADSLSTGRNYVLNASPVALGLASNEYVTEFMAVFGVVPSNFRQVEAPQVYCTVLNTLVGGTQFTNTADAGGVYNGQWIMATDRWVTTVYAPAKPLPRTGY